MEKGKTIIDIVKYRWVWIGLTAILLIPGIVAMGYSWKVNKSPLLVGLDFTGGTMLQYGFDKEITKEDEAKIRTILNNVGIESAIIQTSAPLQVKTEVVEEKNTTETQATVETEISEDQNTSPAPQVQEETEEVKMETKNKYLVSIKTRYLETTNEKSEAADILNALKEEFGTVQVMQVNAIGPTLGQELFKNSLITLLLAFAGIVIYLAFRFQWDYAIFAFLALLHDAIFIIGIFSILGLLYNTQVDAMFVTAILTVIGFSVHDTIVVYDRIRENNRFLAKKMSFGDIANISVNQTLMRSIATSVTTLLTLFALYFLGGETTKDFVLVLILGIAIGTYSSIFFASTLLVMYREHVAKQKELLRSRV